MYIYIQSFNNIHRSIFIAIATISSLWRRSARHFDTNLYYKIIVVKRVRHIIFLQNYFLSELNQFRSITDRISVAVEAVSLDSLKRCILKMRNSLCSHKIGITLVLNVKQDGKNSKDNCRRQFVRSTNIGKMRFEVDE